MATFTSQNYIHVPGFAIVDLKLSGNELLCYSLIYGFSQDGETEFIGSLSYVSSALNVTRQNAKKIIDRLIDRGLVEKRETYYSGVKFCHYVTKSNGVAEITTGVLKSNGGVAETVTGGVAETAHNNNRRDNSIHNIEIDREADGGLFPADQVTTTDKKERGTTESLCLFADSKYADFAAFEAQFKTPEFDAVDIRYYFGVVADWSSSKGAKKRDWIATARNIMRGDADKGRLHRVVGGVALSPDAIDYLQQMSE